ncbi:MAG: Alpha-ketoglutarate-dependent 2,4-dichlorophenoxyacetate dioxygenase [Alphaproteobacteria bacterium MarineAlpha4_Bin2]|nr:MAG: Alpha-ketoglutarate-dependent 2,4-dichlorophenoxyacetate dioxygenase [Alphaproteobacteria bacterium MarineAlpha4_Bin2]
MKTNTKATISPSEVNFDIVPLSALMAAEVSGIDLSQPLGAETRARIHSAFLEHRLLVFRKQALTKEKQVAFTEQFGTLERHTTRNRGTDDLPLVHIVSNLGDDGKPMGSVRSNQWHTDKSFRPAPSMATILHAVTLPPEGGDTVFVDMHAAYEALDEAAKAEIENLQVIHSWRLSRENEGRVMSEKELADAPDNTHPLARVHPETGRKALFVGMHASHIEGMLFKVGRALILRLEKHATQPRYQYRHTWRPGDLLMWDNRCLLHRAEANFDAKTYPRILHRTCLKGTPTGVC